MRDGRGERIVRKVQSLLGPPRKASCGGIFQSRSRARFQRCSYNHVHCTHCGAVAHHFRKAWTCGMCHK